MDRDDGLGAAGVDGRRRQHSQQMTTGEIGSSLRIGKD
jgi:hypothetical protein